MIHLACSFTDASPDFRLSPNSLGPSISVIVSHIDGYLTLVLCIFQHQDNDRLIICSCISSTSSISRISSVFIISNEIYLVYSMFCIVNRITCDLTISNSKLKTKHHCSTQLHLLDVLWHLYHIHFNPHPQVY